MRIQIQHALRLEFLQRNTHRHVTDRTQGRDLVDLQALARRKLAAQNTFAQVGRHFHCRSATGIACKRSRARQWRRGELCRERFAHLEVIPDCGFQQGQASSREITTCVPARLAPALRQVMWNPEPNGS